jgi:hypothetical protein
MKLPLLAAPIFLIIFMACSSAKKNNQQKAIEETTDQFDQPAIDPDEKPLSLMDLPQTQDGGFILRPGFYEAEFKTYCLQPGTPDPRQGDAYLHAPLSGYRKEILETVLLNSNSKPYIDQRNVQLLLWSAVSGSDFNKLSPAVQRDARELLTPKQIFELQGGVVGMIKTVSQSTGILNANTDIRNLFEKSIQSYEAYERIAVRNEASKVMRKGVKYDQWYHQKENYYVRYFPESYKKMKIQVYVPAGVLDSANKLNDEYVVFDPVAKQAVPAYTNAQRLGVGAPVIDILRQVIIIQKKQDPPLPKKKKQQESTQKY